jgi:hypothetical protein
MSLAAEVLSGFLTGFGLTALNGAFASFVARGFTTGRTAKVAAFCVTLGFVVGRFGYSGPAGREAVVALGTLAGGIFALAGLWFWLLRRPELE